jgi:hypothetical protein
MTGHEVMVMLVGVFSGIIAVYQRSLDRRIRFLERALADCLGRLS